ncbi:MAG: hypothetical protein ACR2QH_11775 [Geminicoccaceae bacterium]
MARRRSPVDATAAKKWLRFYAIAIPMASLIGGWCTLLTIAWIAFPEGVVDHIPTVVKGGASAVAAGWLYWSFRMFKILPALIDDILERGLSFDHMRDADH